MQIAVCGNVASGKTTVVKKIAQRLGADWGPKGVEHHDLVLDLFRDPGRFALEAQLSFLRRKIECILDFEGKNDIYCIDRPIEADIDVYPLCLLREGLMSERAFDVFHYYSRLIRKKAPRPSILIFCRASIETCEARVLERSREYEKLYSSSHISNLSRIYEEWLKKQVDTCVVEIATQDKDGIDFRVDQLLNQKKVATLVGDAASK